MFAFVTRPQATNVSIVLILILCPLLADTIAAALCHSVRWIRPIRNLSQRDHHMLMEGLRTMVGLNR